MIFDPAFIDSQFNRTCLTCENIHYSTGRDFVCSSEDMFTAINALVEECGGDKLFLFFSKSTEQRIQYRNFCEWWVNLAEPGLSIDTASSVCQMRFYKRRILEKEFKIHNALVDGELTQEEVFSAALREMESQTRLLQFGVVP